MLLSKDIMERSVVAEDEEIGGVGGSTVDEDGLWSLRFLGADSRVLTSAAAMGLVRTEYIPTKAIIGIGISQLHNITSIMDRDRGVMGMVTCGSWQLSACIWWNHLLKPCLRNQLPKRAPNGTKSTDQNEKQVIRCSFQMPLHYPRFNKADYETMPEWKLDCLFADYGLPVTDDVKQKREFAMGAFLWPSQSD
ncbi:hypothetical protein RHSIM_Rhsim07G0084700 [Rhododendron simsii]|uniref:DUF7722 domain-containing protein n=1 Tax=Rhododendron simsii TaxID=118357 RepID=A0A834LFL3_RHOSS|nr:hypothetical protein RHSIM_Rhsim07G0084700 [Rhododendron simsii]